MASSVSSERAFSSAGITISKCRNRLKGDIVEALQCMKCLIRHDLLFREVEMPTLADSEGVEDSNESQRSENLPWDHDVGSDDELDDADTFGDEDSDVFLQDI